MMPDSGFDRFNLAQNLLSVKQSVAQTITDEFFLIHPEWEVRYGERGRKFCTADACFHVDFLAGAIEANSPEAFADYVRWTARMLGARGIDAHTMQENLDQLQKHISPLLSPVERQAVTQFLALGRQACIEPEPASESQPEDDPLGIARCAFVAAILGGQRQAALTIAEEAYRSGTRYADICVDVFSRSLHHVGKLWEQNKISVAQEHMATAITQYVVAMIYSQLSIPPSFRGNMVVTGVAGELHQIGANLVADTMEENGWNVRFLGSNQPHSNILSTVQEVSADILCISTTLVANLPSVAELIHSVRDKLGENAPRIVLGGWAYQMTPLFARDIGSAEVILDLRQALAQLCA